MEMGCRRLLKIGAAHDMTYTKCYIIDHVGQMVTVDSVGVSQWKIANRFDQFKRSKTETAIVPFNVCIGDIQADRPGRNILPVLARSRVNIEGH